jgi:hypothetical protein
LAYPPNGDVSLSKVDGSDFKECLIDEVKKSLISHTVRINGKLEQELSDERIDSDLQLALKLFLMGMSKIDTASFLRLDHLDTLETKPVFKELAKAVKMHYLP